MTITASPRISGRTFPSGSAGRAQHPEAARPWVPNGHAFSDPHFLADRKPFGIGPFRITPYLVDHSAFDAYALMVEADGKRVFYSGDFRAHGRKAALFERLVRSPPKDIDALLMEGTTLGRAATAEASRPRTTWKRASPRRSAGRRAYTSLDLLAEYRPGCDGLPRAKRRAACC